MRRRDFISLCAGFLASPRLAAAETTKDIAHVGILTMGSEDSVLDAAFRQGFVDHGYTEGKNLTIDFRGAAGKAEMLPRFAAELVAAKVDVIIAAGSQATSAARQSTTAIPIVAISTNPVGLGFAASLAHPGGNITGLSLLGPEVAGKRLELLKEMVPRLSKVAAMWAPEDPAAVFSLKETQVAARYRVPSGRRSGRGSGGPVTGATREPESRTDRRGCTAKADAHPILLTRRGKRGRTGVLWCKHSRGQSAGRLFCRSNSQRRESRRLADRTANAIPTHYQPENGEDT
jgi:hypothetical protein